jgi:hypothetical protein
MLVDHIALRRTHEQAWPRRARLALRFIDFDMMVSFIDIESIASEKSFWTHGFHFIPPVSTKL